MDELYGDRDGIALEMSLSVGETLSTDGSYVPIPTMDDAHPEAQLAIALHEAVELVLVRCYLYSIKIWIWVGFVNIIGNVVVL